MASEKLYRNTLIEYYLKNLIDGGKVVFNHESFLLRISFCPSQTCFWSVVLSLVVFPVQILAKRQN